MSGNVHDQQRTGDKASEDMIPMPRGGTGTVKRITRKLDPDAAWSRVDAVLNGDKKDLSEVALLVSFLEPEQKQSIWKDRWADLVKLGGDYTLDVGLAVGFAPKGAVDLALKSTPKVGAPKLRSYLRSLDAELGDINNIADVRTVLTGKLLDELPHVLHSFEKFQGNGPLIRWLVETTKPELVAMILASNGSADLAKTLDQEQLWGWIDHLVTAPAFVGVHALMKGTSDQAVQDQLKTLLGPMATDDNDAMVKVRAEGKADLHRAYDDDKIDRAKVMEITSRAAYTLSGEPAPRLERLFRKAKLSGTDVVTVLRAAYLDPAVALPILLNTDGVTKEDVLAYVAGRIDVIDLLKNEKVRNALRRTLGKAIGMRDLLKEFDDTAQHAVLRDEALRTWFFADAMPQDLLSLCGADADTAARVCRIVKAERGMDWVYQLTPGANPVKLRRLATHCGDQKLSEFIRGSLLAEEVSSLPATIGAAPENPAVYGGDQGRLADAEKSHDQDGVLARLADMDEKERAVVAADRGGLARLFREMGRDNRLRALSLLGLSFEETVAYATPESGFDRQLVIHLRSRPAAEETAALGAKVTLERALLHVHPDPLQTFPTLLDPKVLAKAIDLSPLVVERVLSGTESSRALALLSHKDLRKKFEAILETRPELVDQLPRYQHLDKKAQKTVDKLEDDAKADGETSDALEEVQSGTHDGSARRDEEAKAQESARNKASTSISDAIMALANEGGDTSGAIELIREHHDQVLSLLADITKWPAVKNLAQLVDLPPEQVFKVGLDRLLLMFNARRWFYEVTPAFVLLQELTVAKAPALVAVASDINENLPGAVDWLGRLPAGPGLTEREEMTLDAIQRGLTNEEPLKALFKARFGIIAPDLDAASLKTTYATLSRLPDAHVRQQRIKELKVERFKGNELGLWTGNEIKIEEGLKPGDGKSTMSPRSGGMTREELRKTYGWDDAQIDAKVKEGHLQELTLFGQSLFAVPDVEVDTYTQVLLHEIGHSVDSILGDQTDLVYDMAGWRGYDEADFDRWAKEMGGWEKVKSEEDQHKIRQAWIDAMRSQSTVASMVDEKHPARSKQYEGVGVVDALRSGHNLTYTDPAHLNGRTFVMSTYYGRFFSLKESAAKTAPSWYSLYAPAEYFAECYVEYYRQVDGTPAGAQQKGGMLPAPIKKWFETHVDKVRFDPKRLQKPDSSS